MSQPSDEELMLAVKARDREAFEELYRRYRDRLYAFLVRYTGEPATAQDLFQETFLRVFRDRARYEPRATFATWLFTIARNLYLDHLRGARRGAEVLAGSATALAAIRDTRPGPMQEIEAADRERLLQTALAGLAEEDRAILLLSRFEGLRYARIAEILGMSEGAVKVRAHRAMQVLRRALPQ